MRGISILVVGLIWGVALIEVRAETPDMTEGQTGLVFGHQEGSRYVSVTQVVAHSPSAEGGIREGDEILAISGFSLDGQSVEVARRVLVGPVGSLVTLAIGRGGAPKLDISLVRKGVLDTYLAAAKEGDPLAEDYVGAFYMHGPVSTCDPVLAFEWLNKSAQQKYVPAEVSLGYLYLYGHGAPKDPVVAAEWFQKAAQAGDAEGERCLGFCCSKGEGMPLNEQMAFTWFQRAAAQNDAVAEAYLGYLYLYGHGAPKDEQQAFNWYYRSAQQANAYAEWALAFMYEGGHGVPRNYPEALDWYQKALKATPGDEQLRRDYGRAAGAFGSMKRFGDGGTAKNIDEAIKWFTLGASLGDAPSERQLAICYYQGKGVEQSGKVAGYLFSKAATQGDAEAQAHLGFFYLYGKGVKKPDDLAAMKWYRLAAEQGNHYAEWGLGFMCSHGRGIKRSDAAALVWYNKALAGLPKNQALRREMAMVMFRDFLSNRSSAREFDFSFFLKAYGGIIWFLFIVSLLFYLPGLGVLLYSSFHAPTGPAGLATALGWLIVYLGGQIVALLGACALGRMMTAASLMGMLLMVAGLPLLIASLGPRRGVIWHLPERSWFNTLLIVVGGFLGIFLLFVAYAWIYAAFSHHALPAQPTHALIGKSKRASLWLTYLVVGLLVPMAEELLFRRYLFDAFRQYLSARLVVVFTALIFSAMHFQPFYFLPLGVLGLFLGWLRDKANSVLPSMGLHALINCVSLTLMA